LNLPYSGRLLMYLPVRMSLIRWLWSTRLHSGDSYQQHEHNPTGFCFVLGIFNDNSITLMSTEYSESDLIIALSLNKAVLVCSRIYFRWTSTPSDFLLHRKKTLWAYLVTLLPHTHAHTHTQT
jgi:hypothetical protein